MKRHVVLAAVAMLATTMPRAARADEGATRVSTAIASNAPAYVVEAAACALPGIRVGERTFDVRYGSHRCSTDPAPPDALEVRVHAEGAQVVLDADAKSETEAESVRVALQVASDFLKKRIADASPVPGFTYAPHRELTMLSPELRAAGITFTVLGSLTFGVGLVTGVAAFVGALDTPGGNMNGLNTAINVLLASGLGAVALGVPMWIIGNKKVVRVTAAASPMGGALRVVF